MVGFRLDARFPFRTVTELATLLRLQVFIETGTGGGHTTGVLAGLFQEAHTIELDPIQANAAKITLAECLNVSVHEGDSPIILKKLLQQLSDSRIFFWLDGHYSGPGTALGSTECPLLLELAEIVAACKNTFVVGIDDARLFENPPPPPHKVEDWPTAEQLFSSFNSPSRRWVKAGDAFFWIPVNELTEAWLFNPEKTGLVSTPPKSAGLSA